MRKILSVFILSVLLVGLAMPILVGAQDQTLKECCIMSQTVDLGGGVTCDKGEVAAPDSSAAALCTGGTWCSAASTDATAQQWGMLCLVSTIYNVTNWIFYLMMIAVVIVFVIAAAWFMMAGGDPEKTSKAKGMMTLGIVGLVIALIAKLIPSVVKLIIGM